MRKHLKLFVAAVALTGLSLFAGYWIGTRGDVDQSNTINRGSGSVAAESGERKVLYYRNPMGLADTSPAPKKDPMGMDYIPVYADEAQQDGPSSALRITTEKIQKLGVRTEAAQVRALDATVRAVGRVEPNERRQYTIAPKFEGYVERLHVNATGQLVGKGQALFEVYSPELISAQREYALAIQGVESLKGGSEEAQRSMRDLAHSSLSRLRNWDISDAQIQALARSGETRRTLTFRSPVSGIVTEKKAVQGMRFEPGEMLYQIVDLSSVWVIADIFEQEIGALKAGAKAQVTLGAYPGRRFEGTMSYVYPTLTPESRTVPVRIELSNPDGALKPGMFAQVEIASGGNKPSLTVPSSAVIDSGTRTVVLVDLGEGRFEPREVKLGARTSQFAEIRAGLRDGELVVVAANFLIDAESNLKAAIGGFGHASHDAAQAPKQTELPAQAVSHRGEGRIEEIDLPAKSITLDHGPIETLKWPAMTMPFEVANAALLQGLKPGQTVSFEFVQRGQGDWMITRITPKASPAPNNLHGGH